MRDNVVVDQADQLVDEEGVPGDAFVPPRGLGLEPGGEFLAPGIERLAQQFDDRLARPIARFLRQRRDPGGQCAPVDNRALSGDALPVHASIKSPANCLRTVRLSIFCVPSRGKAALACQICSASGTLNGASRVSMNSRSSSGDTSCPSLVR